VVTQRARRLSGASLLQSASVRGTLLWNVRLLALETQRIADGHRTVATCSALLATCSAMGSLSRLLALPTDVLLRTLGYLEAADVLAAASACTALQGLAQEPDLWRQLMCSRYHPVLEACFGGVSPSPAVGSSSSWRAHYFDFGSTWMLHARAAGRVVLVLGGEAFDLTDFVSDHPGGPELLLAAAGTDASAAFDAAEHSPNARRLLQRYAIPGPLPAECLRGRTAEPSAWSAALRSLLGLRHAAGRTALRRRWGAVTSALLHDLTEGRPDGRRLSPAIWRLTGASDLYVV
jgi:hypothetical protein